MFCQARSSLALRGGLEGPSFGSTMRKDFVPSQRGSRPFSSIGTSPSSSPAKPVGFRVLSNSTQDLPDELLASLLKSRRSSLEDGIIAWYWRNQSRQVTEVAEIKEEVAAKKVEVAKKEVEVASKEAEIAGLKGQLQWVRANWLRVTGQFHARGLLEYLSDDCYEALGSPIPSHAPGKKVTRKDRLIAVLSDSSYKALLASINVFDPGSPGVVAARLVHIYGILSSHIHTSYTPSEWQSSGGNLRIVEGPLSIRDCRYLEAVCTHLCIPFEVHTLQRPLEEEVPL